VCSPERTNRRCCASASESHWCRALLAHTLATSMVLLFCGSKLSRITTCLGVWCTVVWACTEARAFRRCAPQSGPTVAVRAELALTADDAKEHDAGEGTEPVPSGYTPVRCQDQYWCQCQYRSRCRCRCQCRYHRYGPGTSGETGTVEGSVAVGAAKSDGPHGNLLRTRGVTRRMPRRMPLVPYSRCSAPGAECPSEYS